MSFISLIGLATALLILAASPGPGVFATVSRSLASGFRAALALILGIVVGDIIYLLFAIFGLSIVAQTLGELFIVVKVCCGAYLFYLGFKIFFSAPMKAEGKPVSPKHSLSGNILSGLLITLSNPKVIVFYCGFLPTFIELSTLNLIDISIIVSIVTTVISSVLMTYALLGSSARQLFSSHNAIRRLNRSAGVVMMATGVAIATKS